MSKPTIKILSYSMSTEDVELDDFKFYFDIARSHPHSVCEVFRGDVVVYECSDRYYRPTDDEIQDELDKLENPDSPNDENLPYHLDPQLKALRQLMYYNQWTAEQQNEIQLAINNRVDELVKADMGIVEFIPLKPIDPRPLCSCIHDVSNFGCKCGGR